MPNKYPVSYFFNANIRTAVTNPPPLLPIPSPILSLPPCPQSYLNLPSPQLKLERSRKTNFVLVRTLRSGLGHPVRRTISRFYIFLLPTRVKNIKWRKPNQDESERRKRTTMTGVKPQCVICCTSNARHKRKSNQGGGKHTTQTKRKKIHGQKNKNK